MPEWMPVLWFVISCIGAAIGSIVFWAVYDDDRQTQKKKAKPSGLGALKPGAAGVVWVFVVAGIFLWPLAFVAVLVYFLGHFVMGIPSALQFLLESAHDLKTSR